MPIGYAPLQELLAILLTAASTSTSTAAHGAAATPAIGGSFTVGNRPNVDIELACSFLSASANVPSFHVMIDGTAAGNCQMEGVAVSGQAIYRKVRVNGLAPGVHTLAVFLAVSAAGTTTLSASVANPALLTVKEAP
jgi:hypothetical protein